MFEFWNIDAKKCWFIDIQCPQNRLNFGTFRLKNVGLLTFNVLKNVWILELWSKKMLVYWHSMSHKCSLIADYPSKKCRLIDIQCPQKCLNYGTPTGAPTAAPPPPGYGIGSSFDVNALLSVLSFPLNCHFPFPFWCKNARFCVAFNSYLNLDGSRFQRAKILSRHLPRLDGFLRETESSIVCSCHITIENHILRTLTCLLLGPEKNTITYAPFSTFLWWTCACAAAWTVY